MTRKIGIVGSGVIGRGWIILFARAGYDVHVFDATSGAVNDALQRVQRALVDLQKLDYVRDAEAVFANIHKVKSIEEAVSGSIYVQESVTEDTGVKTKVFLEMDEYASPDTILASSCSAIPPTDFLHNIGGRERCIVAHPFNPPHLMPIVEVVTTTWNTEVVIEQVCALLEDIGQSPAVIRKEVPGYVVNRLQAAVVNEAIHLVDEGVISPKDLDKCMRSGLGLRWAFMGPFQTMELNAPRGFLDYATKFGHAYQTLGAKLRVDKPWRRETLEKIEAWRRSETTIDEIPEQQNWRDRMLLRIRRVIEEEETRS
jgi:L-gulonate 3-dehydrogenase